MTVGRQISIFCERQHVNLLEELLLLAEAQAITLLDNGEELICEAFPGKHPMWAKLRVNALFYDQRSDQEILDLIDEFCKRANLPIYLPTNLDVVVEQDWVSVSLNQFQPFRVGNFWINPSWNSSPIPSGLNELKLDPGLAFGTGMHPTTQLCLEWISEHQLKNKSIIDYGCGSGILGIAAGILGAIPVACLDIDPQALNATQRNGNLNGLQLSILTADQIPERKFDVVIANILADPLIKLANLLSNLIKPGGTLVLAGLLDNQTTIVSNAYPDIGFESNRTKAGWVCLSGIKRASF